MIAESLDSFFLIWEIHFNIQQQKSVSTRGVHVVALALTTGPYRSVLPYSVTRSKAQRPSCP
jgi:hypothetical protein